MNNLFKQIYHQFVFMKKKTQHFIIFVDESISYVRQDDHMTADRFITAFYMINAQRLQALNQLYNQTIYPKNSKREKKSNSVSDKINRKALEVAKSFLTSALILERPACDLNQFTQIKEPMYLSLELLSYIHPVKTLLLELKKHINSSRIKVDVVVDETSQNHVDPCLSLNRTLLHDIAEDLSDERVTFEINYYTENSKKSYGIQVADMLAGAYRKEMLCHLNQINTKLIPFSYHQLTLDSDLKRNPKFLEMLGYVVYSQIDKPQVVKSDVKPNLLFSPKRVVTLISEFIKKQKRIKQTKQTDYFKESNQLLLDLISVNNKSKRQEIIVLCSKFNKKMRQYAKKSGLKPHNYVVTLSNKVDTTHYQKTLKNLRNNLKQLNSLCQETTLRSNVVLDLKVFNKEISKYC